MITTAEYQRGYKAGYEARKNEVEMATVSLAELCLKHRNAGREEVVNWVHEIIKVAPPEVYESWQSKLKAWGIDERK